MFRGDGQQLVSADFSNDALARAAAAGPGLPAFWFMWGGEADPWEARSRRYGAGFMAALRSRGATVAEPHYIPGNHGLGLLAGSLGAALAFLTAGT
ncbi:MAG TPA: hypothetical protein VNK43_10990 [Gemmatimonadales bacterium]|nr:hypothetical protein [Gemmatimonadales bacterium]